MKRYAIPASLGLIAGAVAVCLGQFAAPNEVDQRVSPVYPRNQSYQFLSSRHGSNPYQFNWSSGQWDYVPIPYGDVGAPYRPNSDNAPWRYAPAQGAPPNLSAAGPAPAAGQGQIQDAYNGPAIQPNPPVRENDEELWGSTTRPATQPEVKTVTFQGKATCIRASGIEADSRPHLLLRLRSDGGATGTIDIGNRLDFLGDGFVLGVDVNVTVIGKLGSLDRSPVIFADEITIGGKTFKVMRSQYGEE
jgi:hypothetical protein